jgi:CRISPR system Cascade subunit CasE
MTYLTQAIVEARSARRRMLIDNYAWHKAVWNAFPGQPDRKRDFLTRLDSMRDEFRLLILSPDSPVRPSWSDDWQTKEVPPSYFDAKRYHFQLCANPTKKVASLLADGSPTKNGKRIPLTRREDLVGWIERKAEQGGFAVDTASLQTVAKGREYFSNQGRLGLHNAIEFRGTLAVLERDQFYETFRRGIGSAKAFGFGLLMPIPIR